MRKNPLRNTFASSLVGLFTVGLLGLGLSFQGTAHAADSAPAQPRKDEPEWVTESWRYDSYIGHHRPGATEYNFDVTGTERGRFELYFGQALNGAKVDVWAYTNTGTLWLWHEQRVMDNQVSIGWDGPRVHTVVVRVHHHARHEPSVQRFRFIRQVKPSR